jgi:hypothetical protein
VKEKKNPGFFSEFVSINAVKAEAERKIVQRKPGYLSRYSYGLDGLGSNPGRGERFFSAGS